MAEGPAHGHLFLVVVAVAHKYALGILHIFTVAREIQMAGVILQLIRERLRQSAAGVCISVQQCVRGRSHALAAQIHLSLIHI